MNVSLYQAASALHAMDRWQETIAENLASSSVPGYKKQDFAFAAVQAGLHSAPAASGPGASRAVLMSTGQASTNFQPGEFRVTNGTTDVAVDGKGFFEVQLPSGTTGYTRDGEFHIDAQGQLVTKEGYRVLGDGGPLVLDLNNHTQVSISATGEVSQGSDLKGRLRLTEFSNPRLLQRVSGGYFMAENANAGAAPSTASTLRQGMLESANTSVVMEMANLMSATRTFEANQRMAQIQDERMARTISELGNVTG
jgi:flagellar basal body rod protein FlgG